VKCFFILLKLNRNKYVIQLIKIELFNEVYMDRKIPFTKTQKIIELITAMLLLLMFGYLISIWNSIPNIIPYHYDFAGEANAWSGKSSVLIMPFVGAALYLIITILSFFPQAWNTPVRITEKNYLFVYQNIRNLVSYTKLIFVAVFFYVTFKMANSQPLDSLFLPIFLCLMFVPIAFFIVKIVKGNKKIMNDDN